MLTMISSSKFSKFTFAFINGLVFLILFWVVAGSVYRDILRVSYWSAGGFVFGILLGVALQAFANRFSFANKPLRKSVILSAVLLLEIGLGFFLIGPFIWIQLRLTPVSNLHSICCETPLDYGAASYDKVQLTTADAATISGWYVASTSQSGKIIILIHGYGYDRRGTDFQTKILISAGYGVLLYDLRSHGESTGKLNSFNRMQVYARDLAQVVNYLQQKSEVRKIGVVGISLGAFATLNSSPETLNSFAGLWLDGLRFENFGAQLPINNPGDYVKRIFDKHTRWLAHFYTGEPIPSPSPLFAQIIPTITQPKVMLVSSGLDESERTTNERLIPVLGDNKDLWIIENAWHIGGRFDAPDKYREKLLAFFAQAFSH